MTTKPVPISGRTLKLEPRPPCMLIDEQLVELPPQAAEALARCLARAMRKVAEIGRVAPHQEWGGQMTALARIRAKRIKTAISP
jgi:hypothetical protein